MGNYCTFDISRPISQTKIMNERTAHIVKAAQTLFSRYGYGKTTMGDIATEAGVARQTVYNAFPGKTEILRAVVKASGEDTIAAVQKAWTKSPTLADKMAAFHEAGPIAWFEAVRSSPDWAEMMEGVHQAASAELAVVYEKFGVILAEMFRAEYDDDDLPDPELTALVEFYLSASMNAKYGADDTAHLRARLATIQAAALALLKTYRKD